MTAVTPTKRGIVDELHKPARRNYPRRKVDIRGLHDLWQADLVEMIPYATMNRGYKYLLTVINCCSKFAWAEPLKSKSGKDVTEAMKRVLSRARKAPKNLQVDQGSEFYNYQFEALLREYGTRLYSSYSTKKASIIERFNRTLKTKMWKHFSLQGSYKWLDLLKTLLHEYNHSVHRTIGMRPAEVEERHEKLILHRLSTSTSPRDQQGSMQRHRQLKEGDLVRLSKQKALFAKGYTPNWGTEIFKVARVQPTRPVTYILEDLKGIPIKGGFYAEEVQKTKYPHSYLVEKVLRKSKGKAFVKWLGFDSSHNSWINTTDIV